MIIKLTCVRCEVEFERECSDTDPELPPCGPLYETDPICDDCEHQFLSWSCHAAIM
jgi:hypothetical protein